MRLFVAIPLPEEVRAHLALLRQGLPGARWVPPDNMHLTLRFIGEVNGIDVEDLHLGLGQVRAERFDLNISGIGCFETGHKVHTLWAGVGKSEPLHRLQDKVDAALTRAGVAADKRKFKPHVTLARFRNGGSARVGVFIERHNPFSTGPFAIDRFTLFRSHLGGEGAHYEALVDYPLGGSPWPGQVIAEGDNMR